MAIFIKAIVIFAAAFILQGCMLGHSIVDFHRDHHAGMMGHGKQAHDREKTREKQGEDPQRGQEAPEDRGEQQGHQKH